MIKLSVQKMEIDGSWIALFRTHFEEETGEKLEELPPVSLARIPDHCYYKINRLHEHDHHAPHYKSEEELDTYINRVQSDVKKVLLDAGLISEEEVKDAQTVIAEFGEEEKDQ